MIGYLILILILAAAGWLAWRKFGTAIKKLLNLGGCPVNVKDITPEKLKTLQDKLAGEVVKTKELSDKAKLAEDIRNAAKAISDERKKQTAAREKIAGRPIK